MRHKEDDSETHVTCEMNRTRRAVFYHILPPWRVYGCMLLLSPFGFSFHFLFHRYDFVTSITLFSNTSITFSHSGLIFNLTINWSEKETLRTVTYVRIYMNLLINIRKLYEQCNVIWTRYQNTPNLVLFHLQ